MAFPDFHIFGYLFLFHKLGWRTVIANIFAKNRDGEVSINIGGAGFAQGAIEHEVGAIWSEAHGVFPADKDKSKDIPKLFVLC